MLPAKFIVENKLRLANPARPVSGLYGPRRAFEYGRAILAVVVHTVRLVKNP